MKAFGSMGELATFLATRVPAIAAELHEGLKVVAERIEKTAKSEFGHYQPDVGGFPAWLELADSTKEDRLKKGYTENDPLLRSGELQASIGHSVEGLTALIGSTDEKMVYHEFGTERMPMRPVLGPAGFRNRAVIEKLVGAAAVAGLIGQDRIHEALGYDFKTKD